MIKKISIKSIEYLSLVLVISYCLIGNIYLVFIGMSLAIYEINKDKMYKIYRDSDIDRLIRYLLGIIISDKKETTQKINDHEKDIISLVEIIEESGFIPSIENDDNIHAA